MKIIGNTVKTPLNPKKFGGGGNVDLSEYVKNTDYATSSKGGVVKATKNYGLGITPSGTLYTEKATSEQIDSRQGGYNPIVPSNLEYAVNSVVGEPINALSEKQTEIEERVADLESLTLTYTKDDTTAYEKVAPAECGSNVQIKSIGGASEVVKGKNIIDPKKLDFYNTSGGAEPEIVSYNGDGSITYRTESPSSWCGTTLESRGFTVGKYYYLLLVNDDIKYIDYFDSESGYFEIQCDPDFNEDIMDYEPSATRTIKLMMWQDTSVTTTEYEIVEAPAGTVFEPYTVSFRHATVERVDTLGKNLGYKQYGIKSNGAALDTTILTADTTNKHCYSMIQVKGGTKYTLSKSGSSDNKSAFRVFYFDREPILDETQSIGGVYLGSYSKYTATIPQNAKYLYVRWTEDDITYPCGDVQIELGGTVTEYSPFKSEPLASLIIPEAVRSKDGYGFGIDSTYYNYLEVKDGKVFYHKVVEKIVFNGKENFVINALMSSNYGRNAYQTPLSVKGIEYAPLCTHYKGAKWGSGLATVTNTVLNSNGTLFIFVTDGSQELKDFTTYLENQYSSGSPVTVIIPLAEPIVTDVTDKIIAANPDFATKKGKLLIEGGGRTRFVNANEMPVPNTVFYVTRKE